MPRKVAIVGTSDSMGLAPFADPTWEIWGVNNGYLKMPRWTHWFELHNFSYEAGVWKRRGKTDFRGAKVEDYLRSLDSLKVPVYMQAKNPLIEKSVVFPFKEILEKFQSTYHVTTISWELALAIYENVDELSVYGVDMATTNGPKEASEYSVQRPSCEYWIGVWNGLSMSNGKPRVYIPPEADLLKTRFMYGLQELPELDWEKKCANTLNSMNQRLRQAEMEEQAARDKKMQYVGGVSAIREMQRNWGNAGFPVVGASS